MNNVEDINKIDPILASTLEGFLHEDVRTGDITSERLLPSGYITARIISRDDGCIAGMEEVAALFRILGCKVSAIIPDGATFRRGQEICMVEGPGKNVLRGERVALNLLGRMSGVATKTRRFVERAHSVNGKVRIAATRKTTPGFRYFEKKAVRVGGGDPHRYALDDMVLIKENHIRMGNGIESVLKMASEIVSFSKKIEIEVETFDQFKKVLEFHPDIIMLDNMSSGEVKECREFLCDAFPVESSRPLLEVSGNMKLDTLVEYAPFADIISVGALTHSYRSLDFSMLMD